MSYRFDNFKIRRKKFPLSQRNHEVLLSKLVNYSPSFMHHKMKFSSQFALLVCGLHTFSITNTFSNYFNYKKKMLHGHDLGFQRDNLIHILSLFFFFRFLSSPDKYGASYDLYMKIFLDDLIISNFVIQIL